MKLSILNLSSIFTAIVLLLASCEEKPESLKRESKIFVGVEYDPDLGVKHNELLNQFYKEHKKQLKSRSRSEKFTMVEDFIKEKYSMDVSGVKYKLFNLSPSVSNARINNVALNFDPYLIIDNNRNNMTTEVYNSLNTLFTQTENINSLSNERSFLSSFENQVLNNNNLTTSEKNGLRNMVNVYRHSAEYWDSNMNNWGISSDHPSLVISGIPRDAWQKIAWADIIGGAGGGLLSGPPGVLVGLTTSSLQMAIGVSE